MKCKECSNTQFFINRGGRNTNVRCDNCGEKFTEIAELKSGITKKLVRRYS
jgi:predicted Zn finger-like uncharacterized protein